VLAPAALRVQLRLTARRLVKLYAVGGLRQRGLRTPLRPG
jgi:hypothetical protein